MTTETQTHTRMHECEKYKTLDYQTTSRRFRPGDLIKFPNEETKLIEFVSSRHKTFRTLRRFRREMYAYESPDKNTTIIEYHSGIDIIRKDRREEAERLLSEAGL